MSRDTRWTEADVIAYMTRQGLTLTPVHTLAPETPEGTLLAEIRKLANANGYLLYHTHDSRKSEQGFPDTVLTNGTDVLMYELKDNKRKATEEQQRWLNLLAHTGKIECGIWRPRDYPAICERLTRRTTP